MCPNNPAQFSAETKTEGKDKRRGEEEHSDALRGKQTAHV